MQPCLSYDTGSWVVGCPVLDAFQGRGLGMSFYTQVRMTLTKTPPFPLRRTGQPRVKGRAARHRVLRWTQISCQSVNNEELPQRHARPQRNQAAREVSGQFEDDSCNSSIPERSDPRLAFKSPDYRQGHMSGGGSRVSRRSIRDDPNAH